MNGIKTARMAEDIKREISGLTRELKDPRIRGQIITVVRCDVSNDLSHCKVYISNIEGYEKSKESVKGFESASGFLKRHISNALHLKHCPELKFIADKSGEHSASINKILKEIEKDNDEKQSENKGN